MDDLCNRCLIIRNATTSVRARGNHGELEPCGFPTNPIALAAWAREMLYINRWTIEVNDRTHMFYPVSTWHGDAVCATHLYCLIDAEGLYVNGRPR